VRIVVAEKGRSHLKDAVGLQEGMEGASSAGVKDGRVLSCRKKKRGSKILSETRAAVLLKGAKLENTKKNCKRKEQRNGVEKKLILFTRWEAQTNTPEMREHKCIGRRSVARPSIAQGKFWSKEGEEWGVCVHQRPLRSPL